MRSLQRDWRTVYYAVPLYDEPILDEYGNDTLEVKTVYSDPKQLKISVSANSGEEFVNTFGSHTIYHRTMTYSGISCPLVEGTRIWFGVDVTGPNNYVVIKVADGKNGFLIALREVSSRD